MWTSGWTWHDDGSRRGGMPAAAWLALALALGCCGSLRAEGFEAVGDGQNLWIVLSAEAGKVTILHHEATDPPDVVRPALNLNGVIRPGGAAAGAERLWLIYENDRVQSISRRLDPATGVSGYQARFEPRLPTANLALRALCADPQGLWVLVRVTDGRSLARIEALELVGEEPPPPTIEDDSPDDETPASAPSLGVAEDAEADAQPLPQAQDRLLRLSRNRWAWLPLPERWPHDGPAWLILRRGQQIPTLLTLQSTTQVDELWEYHLEAEDWQRRLHALPSMAECQALVVQDQLVLGHRLPGADALQVQLMVMHGPGSSEVGVLKLEPWSDQESPNAVGGEGGSQPWRLAPDGQSVALVVWDRNQQGRIAWMDLQGRVTPATPLRRKHEPLWSHGADYLVLVVVIAASTLVMFIFWRRDPRWNQLDLPRDLVLADLGTRAAAGLVDLLPCLIATFLLFDVPFSELRRHWPGQQTRGWEDLVPGAVTIGVYVGYGALAELFTARTLGKLLFGLRVTDLRGRPPHLWQVLARNIMKVFELIAWFLLILPAFGPFRQRLGDLVGRTVVVAAAQPPADQQDGDDDARDEP